MNLNNRRAVRTAARDALAANPGNPRLVVLIYVLIMSVSTLAVAAALLVLDNRIAQTGGLGAMHLRSILSTIRTVLPLVQTIALWGLQLGYQGATVRMARRQAVAPRNLLDGFPRFGALVRSILLQSGLYLLLAIGCVYAASFLFMMTPLSADFYELVSPMLADPDALYAAMNTDMALFNQVGMSLAPVVPFFLVLFLLVASPIFYRYRMANYCLLEQPRKGAMAALAESIQMMKGHRISLLKLDLSFWWFYLGQALAAVVLYGDVLLAMAGVALPWSPTVSYFVFYVLALALEGLLYYFFMNRVETAYATVYETLRPKPQPSRGAVLGNIFDLARDYKE